MDGELKAKYRHVLDGLSQLPSLPVIVSKLLAILNSPRSRADDVVRYLEMDVGLSGKILRLANSAYYGLPGKINSIQRAVVQLGFNSVSSLVLSASVYNLFKGNASTHSVLNRTAFWRHSIETALACRAIAELRRSLIDPEIAFTQGMLHDIGIVALESSFADDYQKVVDQARKLKIPLDQIEREHFGMDHGEISAWILERWNIPEIVRIPIQFHHNIEASQYRPYALVLDMANWITHHRGVHLYPQQQSITLDIQKHLDELEISLPLESVLQLCEDELQKAELITNLLRS